MSPAPHELGDDLPDAEWKFGDLDKWLAPGEWAVFLNYLMFIFCMVVNRRGSHGFGTMKIR